MNQIVKPESQGDIVDILLADLAIRVQLSPTNYNLAVSRGLALSDWIDREGSPLHGRVVITYAQGSMAINATIARRLRTDEFDIDLIAQIVFPAGTTAKQALDLLYKAVRGEPGSRYYDMVERRNRCETVHYADGMHLDITPAVLVPEKTARTSLIFHHKPEDKTDGTGYLLWANPFGFAEWFKALTPATEAFVRYYRNRLQKWETAQMARADMEPVPGQKPPHEKSMAVIALQLLKRNRNVRYDNRKCRRPPSVLLSKFAADAAITTGSLFDQLLRLAQHARQQIGAAHQRRELVRVTNPRCDEDVLTDRWPETLQDQQTYLGDLRPRGDAGDPERYVRRESDRRGREVLRGAPRGLRPDGPSLSGAGVRADRSGSFRPGGAGGRSLSAFEVLRRPIAYLLRHGAAEVTRGPTIRAQVERMAELYPGFRVDACDWMAVWTGQLRPIRRPYTVRISYIRRYWIGELEVEHPYRPVVRLLDPPLVQRHPKTGAWAEHLYWDFVQPEHSRLCLYDPMADPPQWAREYFIADHIVPWTVEWLACYELWLATGEWRGGRHPNRRNSCPESPTEVGERNPAPPASPRRDAFHLLGREIGTFASWPLMAAASVASSLPMCWPRWNSASWLDGPSLSTSISSSALPPAASSRLGSPPAFLPESFGTSTETEEGRFFRQAA